MIETYGPPERVRKKKDFIALYKKGCCVRGKYFNLIYLPNHLGYSRMAAVASKKVGNAVVRNRARRRARELFRRHKEMLARPMDLILIAKREMREAAWRDLRERYFEALRTLDGKS
jgi:ribonuclease P protein component